MSHAEPARKSVDDVSVPADHPWRKIPTIALVIGVIGALASAGLAFGNPRQFYFSYLVAFLYFLSFAIGGLFFTIIQFAVRAGWSVVVRRIAECFMAALPIFILLFVPIIFGIRELYQWSHPEVVAHDPVLQHKAHWLSVPYFLIRAGVYLTVWTLVSRFYWKASTSQDASGNQSLTRRMQNFSGPAIILFAFSVTFAALDWIMSLEPHWYSTMYGVYYFAGSLVAIFSAMPIVALRLSGAGLTRGLITPEHFHDLGKLLFAFVVFWTYIAFSQYMLIWYGNLPEETYWFRPRWGGGMEVLSVGLAVGHFIIPFFFLMSRHIKRSRTAFFAAAVWMLFIHLVNLYWLVMPTLHPKEFHPTLVDFTTLLAVGGFFVFAVSRRLLNHQLIPIKDPRLPESLGFENA